MSTLHNTFNLFNTFSNEFLKKFDFYINSFDNMIDLQGRIGLEREELLILSEIDQLLIKTYLFIAESANTTAIGAIRLFSSNLYSDAYSLIRILYEILCLMHWGNVNRGNKEELYYSLFKSRLDDEKQYWNEWKLIKKSQKLYESEYPDFVMIRQKLNNFGGHISRQKIVLGNITSIGDTSASRIFTPNFANKHLLAGLDLTHYIFNSILEEYSKHLKKYNAVPTKIENEIKKIAEEFLDNVRSKLQSFIDPNII